MYMYICDDVKDSHYFSDTNQSVGIYTFFPLNFFNIPENKML